MEANGEIHAPAALFPKKKPPGPTEEEAGGGGTSAGLDAVAKRKNPCNYREYNTSRTVHSLVTILTELPRLLCANACMINIFCKFQMAH
jgi:hypothetical protein